MTNTSCRERRLRGNGCGIAAKSALASGAAPGETLEQHVAVAAAAGGAGGQEARGSAQVRSIPHRKHVEIAGAGRRSSDLISTPYWYGVETHDGQHGWIRRDQLEQRHERLESFPSAAGLSGALSMAAAICSPCILAAVAKTGGAQASRASGTLRANLPSVEKRGGKSTEGIATLHARTAAGARRIAVPGDHPLNRYQRAYYQSAVQVSATASGGSVVRVSTKVTAWYADSTPSHSGYQLLTSNGRLESDLLDQLTDLLASRSC